MHLHRRIIGISIIFLGITLAACSVSNQQVETSSSLSSSNNRNSTAYKPSILDSEIPVAWNHVYLGDIGPMPYSENSWLDLDYAIYSFSRRIVSYGDINWEQVDVYQVEGDVLQKLVAHWKDDDAFNQDVERWEQVTIDGKPIDVVTFKTEPDGTVNKGATGGQWYFLPPHESNRPGDFAFGLILHKQAKGEMEFEEGFAHFIQSLKLSELPRITFMPGV